VASRVTASGTSRARAATRVRRGVGGWAGSPVLVLVLGLALVLVLGLAWGGRQGRVQRLVRLLRLRMTAILQRLGRGLQLVMIMILNFVRN
jgi:hypothetical protein